jgi:hypothetical protein
MCNVRTILLCLAPSGHLANLVLVGALGGIASDLLIRWIGHLSGNDAGYEVVDQTSVPPAVHMTEHYAEAWQDRRRRMVVFKTVQISFFPMILVLWYLSSIHPEWRRLILAIPAWFITYMAAGVWLNRFRCPRCGQLYYWRAQLKGSMQRQRKWRDCRYCGLQQDQCPSG